MAYLNFEYEVFYAAAITLIGIGAIAIAFTACCLVHRRKDPLRIGLLWLKIALFLFSTGTVFTGLSAILACLYNNGLIITIAGQEALSHLSQVGGLFVDLSYFFILLSTVDLGIGFLRGWNVALTAGKFLRWAAYGLVVLLTLLRIAGFAGIEAYYVALFNYRRSRGSSAAYSPTLAQVYNRLIWGTTILLWLGGLAALALTISVAVMCKKQNPGQHKATTLLLVASIMSFVSLTWSLALTAMSISGQLITLRVTYIGTPLVDFLFQFIALILLFVLGNMKFGGIGTDAPLPGTAYGQQMYYPQQYVGMQYMSPAAQYPPAYGQNVQYQAVPNPTGWAQQPQHTAIPPSLENKALGSYASELPNVPANHPTNHFANIR